MNRRNFMKHLGTGALTAGLFSHMLPANSSGNSISRSPNDRIQLGVIGTGGIGMAHLNTLFGKSDCHIHALCDVDQRHLERAASMVEEGYRARYGKAYRGCARYTDYRLLLERHDIDAVFICTPDHWHVLMAIDAMRSGKDVYCEKPLTLTVDQGKALRDAVKRFGKVLQVGTQLRSHPGCKHVCELVRNGVIGKVHTVRLGIPHYGAIPMKSPQPVPDWLDYDMWLGPAPYMPYMAERTHTWFRIFRDYSGGTLTDHGAHMIDLANWALGLEKTGPEYIRGHGNYPANSVSDLPIEVVVTAKFPSGVEYDIRYDHPLGCRFEGENGWIELPVNYPPDKLPEASEPWILEVQAGANDIRLNPSTDHHQNFLDSIRTREEPIAPVDDGHRAITVAHLGLISIELGRSITWDAHTEQSTDTEVNRMLSRTMREPWVLV